jgi:hypothetical protein
MSTHYEAPHCATFSAVYTNQTSVYSGSAGKFDKLLHYLSAYAAQHLSKRLIVNFVSLNS